MILTVAQLIEKSMRDAKLLKLAEAPSPTEIQSHLIDLNMLIDQWGTESIMVLGSIFESFALTAGKFAYTIGAGADFNTTVPTNIDDAFIQDNMKMRYPVGITDISLYRTYEDALITTSRPEEIAFDPGPTQQPNRIGVIYTYPIPDASMPYTLYIGQQKELTEFSNPMDVVSFQKGYYMFLRSSLAELLWGQYQDGPVPPQIRNMRSNATSSVAAMNARPSTVIIDVGKRRGGYNIFKGSYGGDS